MINCFRKAITFKRSTGANDVNGFWVDGPTVDVEITASVQPMKPEEMQKLPEGRRSDETFKVFTSTKLLTATSDNPQQNADYTVIDGFKYEVISVGKHQSGVIDHYKVLIQKKSKTQ